MASYELESLSDWYRTDEARKMVREFHYDFAREPRAMDAARQRHTEIMAELEAYLKHEKGLLSRYEFTGSAYEGLKVAGKELEFDVMFVLKNGNQLRVEKDVTSSRYGHLYPKDANATIHFKSVSERGEVLPFHVRDKFHGELQRWLNRRVAHNPALRGEIKIRYGGPAIRAVVYRYGEEWFNVDLVPAYEVINGFERQLYVAKPRGDDDTLWRHSLSVEEKNRLQNIDGPDNGCRKKVVRILKVVRDKEPGLDKMVSFYIKNLIIEMTDSKVPRLDWSEKNFALRLRDVMIEMACRMDRGVLNHPCDDSMNILEDLSYPIRQNIATRLRRIVRSEIKAKKIFGGSFVPRSNSFFNDALPSWTSGDVAPRASSADGMDLMLRQREEKEDADNSLLWGVGGVAAIGLGLLAGYGIHKYMQANKKE